MSNLLIGLCGYPGVGKDTVASYLEDNYPNFFRIAFADALRASLAGLNPFIPIQGWFGTRVVRLMDLVAEIGWDEAKRKYPIVREYQQRMGTEAGRDIHGIDCWVKAAGIRKALGACNVVVTDVRFPNEVAHISKLGGLFWHITRPGFGKINNHASEQLDYGLIATSTLVNDWGVEELYRQVDDLMKRQGYEHSA